MAGVIRVKSKLMHAALAAAGALAGVTVPVETAQACGGLFCSGGGGPTVTTQSAFVNQTAERIVFVDNDDGTVTAIIQIVYQGPADRFAWILPVPGVPDVKVSSNIVLDALQQQTNPQYTVTTTQLACPQPSGNFGSGSCGPCGFCSAGAPSGGTGGLAPPMSSQLGGEAVVVEAMGSIGPYDYTVLSVTPFALDPASVAIEWLAQNQFDVGELGPEVLRPYLEDGLNLLAFRLSKQASVGSIRPVMLTYEGEQASIPIIPTAVAADDDMGVLVWIAAQAQAVPLTYSSVVLNEAVIDWFNPASNYGAVVSAAADEAGGRAFATEFAGAVTLVKPPGTENWDAFVAPEYANWREQVTVAFSLWGGWDGFDEALDVAASLPEGTTLADFRRCLPALGDPAAAGLEDCAPLLEPGGELAASVDMALFEQKLDELVVSPVTDSYAALSSQPYLTRLYTTLSPDEMTVDPVFVVNRDLPMVSNLHTTQRTVQCGATAGMMQLPQGTTIVTSVGGSTWPVQMEQLPAALRIVQHGIAGPGRVLVDESASVVGQTFGVAAVCGRFPGTGGSGGTAGTAGSGGTSTLGGTGGAGGTSGFFGRNRNPLIDDPQADSSGGGGCRAAGDGTASVAGLLAIAASVLALRRRKRPA